MFSARSNGTGHLTCMVLLNIARSVYLQVAIFYSRTDRRSNQSKQALLSLTNITITFWGIFLTTRLRSIVDLKEAVCVELIYSPWPLVA